MTKESLVERESAAPTALRISPIDTQPSRAGLCLGAGPPGLDSASSHFTGRLSGLGAASAEAGVAAFRGSGSALGRSWLLCARRQTSGRLLSGQVERDDG